MNAALVVAIAMAVAFAVTNGLHDASNAIAALVATRAATPGRAIVLASVFNVLGPLLVDGAVAQTIGGIVTVAPDRVTTVIGAALTGAVAWNLLTWRRGLPSSSGHALVGGLVGAGIADAGVHAVRWGGLDGLRPVGVLGTLIALAVSPVAGALAAFVILRAVRRAARRATRRWRAPVGLGEWATSAALAFSHGANDAQKAIGICAALLLADGRISTLSAPTWTKLACGAALTVGTALGGWRIIHTVGRGIYRLRPLDGLVSQGASAAVIFGSSVVGAPTSTTQVVASSIVGVGGGRRQWHHVRWAVVRAIGVAWLLTLPASAALAVVALPLWRALA